VGGKQKALPEHELQAIWHKFRKSVRYKAWHYVKTFGSLMIFVNSQSGFAKMLASELMITTSTEIGLGFP
jgi:hypothetical protein